MYYTAGWGTESARVPFHRQFTSARRVNYLIPLIELICCLIISPCCHFDDYVVIMYAFHTQIHVNFVALLAATSWCDLRQGFVNVGFSGRRREKECILVSILFPCEFAFYCKQHSFCLSVPRSPLTLPKLIHSSLVQINRQSTTLPSPHRFCITKRPLSSPQL